MLLIKSSLYIYVDCHGIVIKFWAKQDDSNANLKPNTTKVFELVKIVIVSDPWSNLENRTEYELQFSNT